MRQQFGKDIHCDLIFVHASFYMYRLRFATVAKKYLVNYDIKEMASFTAVSK